MSETPTIPLNDVKTSRVAESADRILNDPYESAAFFAQAEHQLAPRPHDERWDLDEPVQAFNPDRVPQEAAVYALPPEYVAAPKTRAQEVEESLFFLDDKQLVAYARANTAVIPMLRKQSRSNVTLAA